MCSQVCNYVFPCNKVSKVSNANLGPKVIKLCFSLNSAEYLTTNFGNSTFICIINTASERLKAMFFFICRYFSFYEQLKFHAKLSWAWKSFITSEPEFLGSRPIYSIPYIHYQDFCFKYAFILAIERKKWLYGTYLSIIQAVQVGTVSCPWAIHFILYLEQVWPWKTGTCPHMSIKLLFGM